MTPSAWAVPLFDLDYGPEEEAAVRRVIQSRWLTQGPETLAFEEEFGRYLGGQEVVMTSSGTTALHLAYLAAGLQPGDEVIVPSMTFIATVSPLLWMGVRVVFADLRSPEQPVIGPETVEPLITPRTRAVVFVSYNGLQQGLEDLYRLCEDRGLLLIEDAAHATGGLRPDGRPAGSTAHLTAFSFFANKTLPVGEGGALATPNPDFARTARLLRSHGMTSLTWDRYRQQALTYDVVALGFNYRATELAAALARVRLQKLPREVARRRERVALYRSLLREHPLPLKPVDAPLETGSHYIFPVLLDRPEDRAPLMHFLKDRGIQTSIHYPPVHRFRLLRERYGTETLRLPHTEDFGRRELTLPLYSHMTPEQVRTVVEALHAFFSSETPPAL